MTKTIAIIIATSTLALTGCNQATGGIDVGAVQSTAVKICSYEPTAQTVVSIFNTGSPLLDSIQEIAAAVCQAINTPRAAGQPAMVAGVVVQGTRK